MRTGSHASRHLSLLAVAAFAMILMAGRTAAAQAPSGEPTSPADPPAPHVAPNGAPINPVPPPAPVNANQNQTPQTPATPAPLGPNGAPVGPNTSGAPKLNLVSTEEPNYVVREPEREYFPTSDSGSSLHQGVVVHGHWVIDVKNPDGTLTGHREFENSLSGSGAIYLVGTLSGYLVPGDWMIVLGATSGNGPCVATFQFCGITRSLSTYPALGYCASAHYCGTGLTYAYNFGTNLGGPYSIVLSGSITSNQTGSVGVVYTILGACSNTSSPTSPSSLSTASPSTCTASSSNGGNYYGPLTGTNLASSVPVTNGQIIQVTVTISFS